MTMNASVWGRSERLGPFGGAPLLRIQRWLVAALPWQTHGVDAEGGANPDMDASPSRGAQKAAIYNTGPDGPTRRQRQEMQRRAEQARRADRIRLAVQAAAVALAGILAAAWAWFGR